MFRQEEKIKLILDQVNMREICEELVRGINLGGLIVTEMEQPLGKFKSMIQSDEGEYEIHLSVKAELVDISK